MSGAVSSLHQDYMPDTRKYLSLVALAPNNDRLAADLTSAVNQRGCEIVECRLSPLGGHTAAVLLISGDWSALGKLESALPGLAEQMGLLIQSAHSHIDAQASQYRPYVAELVAPQQAKLLYELINFLDNQGVRISEINAQAYESAHTGAGLCNVHMALQIPSDQHPQALRESFMDLCDELQADGMLDPIKA